MLRAVAGDGRSTKGGACSERPYDVEVTLSVEHGTTAAIVSVSAAFPHPDGLTVGVVFCDVAVLTTVATGDVDAAEIGRSAEASGPIRVTIGINSKSARAAVAGTTGSPNPLKVTIVIIFRNERVIGAADSNGVGRREIAGRFKFTDDVHIALRIQSDGRAGIAVGSAGMLHPEEGTGG